MGTGDADRDALADELADDLPLFRDVVEQAGGGVYLLDGERFAYVNPALADLFGYSRTEFLALPSCLALVVPADRPLAAELLRRRLTGQLHTAHYTFRAVRRDGAEIAVEVMGTRT